MAQWRVLTEFEAAVDAVCRCQGGGQNEPDLERRSPARLQVLVQDVGGIREEVRPHELLQVGLRELGEVLAQLGRAVAPGEVGVRLIEAGLCEMPHQLRTSEGLGKKYGVGMRAAH